MKWELMSTRKLLEENERGKEVERERMSKGMEREVIIELNMKLTLKPKGKC